MSVDIYPGTSIQAVVNANPEGTTFILKTGTHTNQQVQPKNNQSFIGEAGTILDGGGATAYAFGGIPGGNGGQYVTLSGLIVQNYAPAAQAAAIRPYGYAWYWTVEDCEICYNDNWGVMVDSGWHVANCYIHHNGTMGLGGGGDDPIVEYCHISWNNTSHADSHWEAGGMKFVYSDGMIVRLNNVHDNEGPGIWFDGNSDSMLVESNVIDNNYGPGVDIEINGAAIIRYNTVTRNGFGWTGWIDGAGILIANSDGCEVYGNTVEWNNDGIGGIQSDRGAFPDLKNLSVHDNIIKMDSGCSGMVESDGSPIFSEEWNNLFDNNTYTVEAGCGSTPFYGNPYNSTWAQWQAIGQDLNSTYNEEEETGASVYAVTIHRVAAVPAPSISGELDAQVDATTLSRTAALPTPYVSDEDNARVYAAALARSALVSAAGVSSVGGWMVYAAAISRSALVSVSEQPSYCHIVKAEVVVV